MGKRFSSMEIKLSMHTYLGVFCFVVGFDFDNSRQLNPPLADFIPTSFLFFLSLKIVNMDITQ